jgi:hypothetical protein
MQLIDTPTGRYCIADGRDLGAFLKALKTASKPKRPRVIDCAASKALSGLLRGRNEHGRLCGRVLPIKSRLSRRPLRTRRGRLCARPIRRAAYHAGALSDRRRRRRRLHGGRMLVGLIVLVILAALAVILRL